MICPLSTVNLALALIPHHDNGHASPNVETTGSVSWWSAFPFPLRALQPLFTHQKMSRSCHDQRASPNPDSCLTSVAPPLWTQRRRGRAEPLGERAKITRLVGVHVRSWGEQKRFPPRLQTAVSSMRKSIESAPMGPSEADGTISPPSGWKLPIQNPSGKTMCRSTSCCVAFILKR